MGPSFRVLLTTGKKQLHDQLRINDRELPMTRGKKVNQLAELDE